MKFVSSKKDSMNKIFLLSILFLFGLTSCGGRQVLLPAMDKSQTYRFDKCGIQVTIPGTWRLEMDMELDYHVVKEPVDVIVDVISETNVEEIWDDIKDEIERKAETSLKGGRVEPKKINSLKAVTIYHMSQDGALSVDVDGITCPSGTGSMIFYTYSPVKSYARDRAAVKEIFNSAKPL